jgi:hypothetical protein
MQAKTQGMPTFSAPTVVLPASLWMSASPDQSCKEV